MTAAEWRPFRIGDPLPTDSTLLEASAGTGKTWTVGALVTRYVAEGVASLDEMLVVTFGRAASQELRERTRDQLVAAERVLADPGQARDSEDELVRLLADASDDEVALRRKRLREALAGFDAATIATTHQFCQLVLRSLGVAGDTDSGATLVEDLDDLVVEVADDLYLARFGQELDPPPFDRSTALRLAREAVNDSQAQLEPADAGDDPEAEARVRFACDVRAELDRRKRRLGVLSYDDLLSRLAAALEDEDAPARDRMRRRWRIVLVDEFQDTDPVQWQVIDRAFSGWATLVLIGDPKQAIYAFRGGDIVTYLEAAQGTTHRATLATNWRSDRPLVESLQTLLEGAALGDERIVVRDVRAAHESSRLQGAPVRDAFRLRVVRRIQGELTQRQLLKISAYRDHVARDLAADVARLLASGASYDGRALVAADVAVLVATGAQALLVRDALATQGVHAVLAGSGSVFASPAATEWLTLLEALEQPHRSGRVRAAALTCFLGYSAREIDEGGDPLTDRLGEEMRDLADLLDRRGVAAVFEAVSARHGMTARVLARVDGERTLTDIRHIAQSMHEESVRERLGLTGVLRWLREQCARADADKTGERTRRLDSDAAAVQIVTVHSSKGLQYPVVYLPFVADRHVGKEEFLRLHDGCSQRILDVGGAGGAGRAQRERRARAEDDGESLRLLYVALTRAQSQVVAWWGPTTNTAASALHRVLFGRAAGDRDVPGTVTVPSDQDAKSALEGWATRGVFVLEPADPPESEPRPVRAGEPGELVLRRLRRSVDTTWRRTSYTALTRVDDQPHHAEVGSEPEVAPRDDEEAPPSEPEPGVADIGAGTPASPMADLPVGATFGSLVHGVLETADPEAADLEAELAARAREQLARWPVPVTPENLAAALLPVCTTPLGPLAEDRTLRHIGHRDRLCELDFELPLAGGDLAAGTEREVLLGDVAELLRAHLPDHDPLRGYADRLALPALADQRLRGYLAGSLDVVLRVPGERHLVVDYKTNWLGTPDLPLTAWDYRQEALAATMVGSHYPLQALLYSVVLHRFLRWRQPGYEPARHLGGILYLFVRGMCGPDTPVFDGQPCGVFAWRPPTALVSGLSQLLAGRSR